MKMVNVIDFKKWEKYPIHTYEKSPGCLYALDKIIGLKNYDMEIVKKTASILYHNLLLKNEIYVDSGGYSIINGKVKYDNIDLYLKYYLECVESIEQYADFIFSLDIPFFMQSLNQNKQEKIYSINRFVMTELIKISNEKPSLADKLFWVTHFKTLNIYNVWKRLDQDIGISEVFQNKAIGGLVGLRNLTRKKFSLFIGSAFKCFFDYYRIGKLEKDFRLHFLGVYLPHDRLIITILENIFNLYLHKKAVVMTSYDSFSFELYAANRWYDKIYHFEENKGLISYDDISKVPASVINSVYSNNNLIYDEIRLLSINQRCVYRNSIVPLIFHSHCSIDRFFTFMIHKWDLINLIVSDNDENTIKFRSILSKYQKKYPELFNRNFIDNIQNSIVIIKRFHKWFMSKRDMYSLNGLMSYYINLIGLKELIF